MLSVKQPKLAEGRSCMDVFCIEGLLAGLSHGSTFYWRCRGQGKLNSRFAAVNCSCGNDDFGVMARGLVQLPLMDSLQHRLCLDVLRAGIRFCSSRVNLGWLHKGRLHNLL